MAGYHHARRAVAALKSVVFNECFLNRAQFTVRCQPFDGRDLAVIRLHSQMETGFNNFAIEQHGAGAALADDAADMSPSEADVLAQKMRKKQPWFDVFFIQAAVDRHVDRSFHQIEKNFSSLEASSL